MKPGSRPTAILGLLAAGLVVAVAAIAFFATSGRAGPGSAGPPPAPAARTSFPGLAAATGEPELASLRAARPRSGQILQVSGPFDDRFVLESPAFDGSAVSGAVRITSDVSEVLELQVVAGFYDKLGNLLGTNRFVHHLGDHGEPHVGAPEERTSFKITVPAALAHRAASVTIGVPVLVNE